MKIDQKKKQFQLHKVTALTKGDKSKVGRWDEQILPLLDEINKHNSYYTTSSCAGRILVLTESEKKHDVEWLIAKHGAVSLNEMDAVEHLLSETKDTRVWIKQEPMILHVCANDLDSAALLIQATKQAGLKHSAIMGISPKIMVEIVGIDRLAVPIAENGKYLISREYLGTVLNIAAEKLEKNYQRISRILECIKQIK